jgi:hypothetical protein
VLTLASKVYGDETIDRVSQPEGGCTTGKCLNMTKVASFLAFSSVYMHLEGIGDVANQFHLCLGVNWLPFPQRLVAGTLMDVMYSYGAAHDIDRDQQVVLCVGVHDARLKGCRHGRYNEEGSDVAKCRGWEQVE